MISASLQIILFANILVFMLVSAIRFSHRWHMQVVVVGWGLSLVAVSYLIADNLGASELTYELLGMTLPWYSVGPVLVSLVFFANGPPSSSTARSLTTLAVCSTFTWLSNEGFMVEIANQAASEPVLLMVTFLTVFSFSVSVLASSVLYWDGSGTIIWKVFRVTAIQVREHWLVFAKGLGWFVLAFFATNIWVEGNIVNLYFIQAPGVFVRDACFTTFYVVLIRHFVFIALAKYVIDVLFPHETTSMVEILVFACLLAGFQYYLHIGLIVREFLFGLIFGYWYLKTKSLSYGIIVRSLSLIFT